MDWLDEELAEFGDDYLIIDCPGQIEIYTHFPIMKQVVSALVRLGYSVCGVYLIDSQFIDDPAKYFAGVLSAMSAMLQLEIPHVNIMSKMDLLGKRAHSAEIEQWVSRCH
jgi:GTPase SAR1 family protein